MMYVHNLGSCTTFEQVYIFVNIGGLMGKVLKLVMFCQASVMLEKREKKLSGSDGTIAELIKVRTEMNKVYAHQTIINSG